MSISEAKSGILQIRGEWEAGKYQAHHAATMIGNLLLGAFDHIAHTPDGTVFVEDVRTSAKREMLHQDEDGNLVRQNEALPRGWHAFVRAAYLLIQWTGPCPFAGHEHEYLTVGVERIVAWLDRQRGVQSRQGASEELLALHSLNHELSHYIIAQGFSGSEEVPPAGPHTRIDQEHPLRCAVVEVEQYHPSRRLPTPAIEYWKSLLHESKKPSPDMDAIDSASDKLHDWTKARIGELSLASANEVSPPTFVPIEQDIEILRELACRKTRVCADTFDVRGVGMRMVKQRLPQLEKHELVDRAEGKRRGFAITKKGIDLYRGAQSAHV